MKTRIQEIEKREGKAAGGAAPFFAVDLKKCASSFSNRWMVCWLVLLMQVSSTKLCGAHVGVLRRKG